MDKWESNPRIFSCLGKLRKPGCDACRLSVRRECQLSWRESKDGGMCGLYMVGKREHEKGQTPRRCLPFVSRKASLFAVVLARYGE